MNIKGQIFSFIILLCLINTGHSASLEERKIRIGLKLFRSILSADKNILRNINKENKLGEALLM